MQYTTFVSHRLIGFFMSLALLAAPFSAFAATPTVAELQAEVAKLQAELAALQSPVTATFLTMNIFLSANTVVLSGTIPSAKAFDHRTDCALVTVGQADWGDGATDTIKASTCTHGEVAYHVVHTYTNGGAYTAAVSDENGQTIAQPVSVIVPKHAIKPTLSLTATSQDVVATGDLSLTSRLAAACVPQTAGSIDWGDHTTAPVVVTCAARTYTTSHHYATIGSYLVTFTNKDGNKVRSVVWVE